MCRILTLAVACALLGSALGSPNRASGLERSGNVRHLLQAGGGAGQNATGAGQADGDAAGGQPASAVITTISLGEMTVKCEKWDPAATKWTVPSSPEYTPKGSRTPEVSTVQPFAKQICTDAPAAGKALQQAVQAGGEQAENWVFALFFTECADGDSSALSKTYQTAIDIVNSGDAAGLKAVQDWFTKFAKAADTVGIPFCASVALVSTADGKAIQESTHHSG
ncbi:DNA mismatch repair [Micractinium conductrix]|uniref:DNA mismatch repair n=1 Tax=Micractinium conductrix TaxID=554055 RepID=A0A2P6V0L9_9CHLO|nr:DNA mismatch repair [Micractinium conductrix]|eukprot:PSC67637.1 DNA mismatch repair [Micractinium conductrix]